MSGTWGGPLHCLSKGNFEVDAGEDGKCAAFFFNCSYK